MATIFSSWCAPSAVRAHAPLAREVALAPDGERVAVRMPGFGWVVRGAADEPFVYVCDALLGVEPLQADVPFAYRADGSLLVGTANGLRRLAPDGCPASSAATELSGVPVVALAVHPDDANLVHALADGAAPELYRSDDGGEQWELRSRLPAGAPVTALVLVAGDPESVYVSRSSAVLGTTLSKSTDAGASFEPFAQARDLVMLHSEPGPGGRLWARASADAPPRVALMRAELAEGPWQEALRVNFFGGFAIDASTAGDVVWIGDEGGGLFRSEDGGESFDELHADVGVACLGRGREGLWACTPGLPDAPAVVTLARPDGAFDTALVLAEVDRLVECGPALDVASVCAAAWNEWRVDVLGGALATPPAIEDAGLAEAPDTTGSAGDATPEPTGARSSSAAGGGCRASGDGSRPGAPFDALAFLFACVVVLGRARVAAYMRASFASAAPEHPPDEASDVALMERACRGDVDAFAGIYDRHAPAILALLLRMLGAEPEARDLLHDVFLEAWRSVRTYDPGRASVRTWLFVRARSRALDRMGRRGREDEARRSLAPARIAAGDGAATASPERRLAVRRALDGLDPDVRETLELTYYGGLTAAEIGERMAVPVGTVKSRLARGLKKLAVHFGDSGGTSDEQA